MRDEVVVVQEGKCSICIGGGEEGSLFYVSAKSHSKRIMEASHVQVYLSVGLSDWFNLGPLAF